MAVMFPRLLGAVVGLAFAGTAAMAIVPDKANAALVGTDSRAPHPP
jgi:hypothetical protein